MSYLIHSMKKTIFLVTKNHSESCLRDFTLITRINLRLSPHLRVVFRVSPRVLYRKSCFCYVCFPTQTLLLLKKTSTQDNSLSYRYRNELLYDKQFPEQVISSLLVLRNLFVKMEALCRNVTESNGRVRVRHKDAQRKKKEIICRMRNSA